MLEHAPAKVAAMIVGAAILAALEFPSGQGCFDSELDRVDDGCDGPKNCDGFAMVIAGLAFLAVK